MFLHLAEAGSTAFRPGVQLSNRLQEDLNVFCVGD